MTTATKIKSRLIDDLTRIISELKAEPAMQPGSDAANPDITMIQPDWPARVHVTHKPDVNHRLQYKMTIDGHVHIHNNGQIIVWLCEEEMEVIGSDVSVALREADLIKERQAFGVAPND